MARISSFTIFVFVTLVVYTILSGAIVSTMAKTTFSDPYGGAVQDWTLAPLFQYSEVHNLTRPHWSDAWYNVEYTTLQPNRKVSWHAPPAVDEFVFKRKGISWWDSWYWYEMAGTPKSVAQVLANWNSGTNYTKYVFDQGGQFETYCFIYPRCVSTTNMSKGFVYYPLSNSIGNGTVTIVLACNATYYSYDVGALFGVLTGFTYYGAPPVVAVLLGGIWWILCLLAIVKLVIG